MTAPLDTGVSSLSSSSRRRREGSKQFASRFRAEVMNRWRCINCGKSPAPRFLHCSDACVAASEAKVRAKRPVDSK